MVCACQLGFQEVTKQPATQPYQNVPRGTMRRRHFARLYSATTNTHVKLEFSSLLLGASRVSLLSKERKWVTILP